LNFIFGIVCLFVCVCAFSLRRESPDMILGDKPLIFEVVLSQFTKVLIKWLTRVAESFIGKTQITFLSGRNILEGVIILHETLHELKRKKRKLL
jgi:hypothetical protein